MFYTVYKITNTINGKIYIGVHKTDNLNDGYMGSGTHLKRAQAKYGLGAFKKEFIQIFDNPDDMFKMESTLVNEDFVSDKNTYNLKLGGEGGFGYINDNIELREASMMNNLDTLRLKMEQQYGEEWQNKINEMAVAAKIEKFGKDYAKVLGRLGGAATLEKYGHGSFKGKTHTEEAKAAIGEKNSKKQKGSGNSQFGTCWVHSLIEQQNKKISKDELETYIGNGWLKGRKMKF